MRLLERLADDILGENREARGSDDPQYAAAFEVIEAHSFYGRPGFTA